MNAEVAALTVDAVFVDVVDIFAEVVDAFAVVDPNAYEELEKLL